MAVWIFETKQTLQTKEANCHLWYCEILLTRHWGVTAVFSYLTDVTAAKHYSRSVSTVLMSPDSGQQPKQESLFLSAATAAKNNSTRQIQLTRTERVGPAYRTHGTHCRLIRVEQAVPDTSRRSVYSWILSSFFNLNRNPLCSCATHTQWESQHSCGTSRTLHLGGITFAALWQSGSPCGPSRCGPDQLICRSVSVTHFHLPVLV